MRTKLTCFRGLQNYTTLKRNFRFTRYNESFRGLQNYTTLKLFDLLSDISHSFRGLQNYTTLKPQIKFEAQE